LIQNKINRRPREKLILQTPLKYFLQLWIDLSHLRLESTFR
jgi:hypothetical protein